MKKLAILIAVLLGISITMLAQIIEPPTSVLDAVGSFKFLINSFAGASALLFFLIPTVLGLLRITGKFWKYFFTILTIALVTITANVLSIGFLHDLELWAVILSGGMLFMVHLGLFSWEYAKEIQDNLYKKLNPKIDG